MPNIDEAAKAWELELSRRFGEAVLTGRKALGLTAVQLAEKTRKLGYPISRVAISKIETNKRAGKVDVAELLVLAAALDTSPVVLLYPGPYDNETELLPRGVKSTEFVAAQLFSGSHDAPHPAAGTDFYRYRQNMQRLRNARTLHDLEDRRKFLVTLLRDLGDSADDRLTRTRLTDELVRIESDIERYRSEDGSDA